MEIKTIYEHIDINIPADYQVKVKGDLKRLITLLKPYDPTHISSETADTDHQVYMIRLSNMTQSRLFLLIGMLLHYKFPVISINCTQVMPKKTDVRQTEDNNRAGNGSSIAISA
jgi:hypothetical protein